MAKSVYSKLFDPNHTPQSEPIPDQEHKMIQNAAGGYTFQITPEQYMRRFLILGSEGGTYYIGEKKLTIDNARNIQALLKKNGHQVVDQIVEVSKTRLAPKNDPAIFALALAMHTSVPISIRQYAAKHITDVCRTGTHILQFADMIDSLRPWGAIVRRAVSSWYLQKSPEKLAYQIMKYGNRAGWTHKDVLRSCHPKPKEDGIGQLFRYIAREETSVESLPEIIQIVHRARRTDNEKELINLIREHKLEWEFVPTNMWSKKVWTELLPNLQYMALVRNLPTLTRYEVLRSLEPLKYVVDTVSRQEAVLKSGIHPMNLLLSAKTYAFGQGKGSSWNPIPQVTDALDEAFRLSYGNVEPIQKDALIAVDCSGSMGWCSVKGASTNLKCHEVAAAMGSILRQQFRGELTATMGFDTRKHILDLSPRRRIDDIVQNIMKINGGGTDCAVPIREAIRSPHYDIIIVLTDNETWQGRSHPMEEFWKYKRMNPKAKLVVCSFAATESCIGDVSDPSILETVGLDASVPKLVSDFCLDRF